MTTPTTNTQPLGPVWVLIETGSNQKYIFSTTKQRLQVAASAAIWDLGYTWIGEAAEAAATNHGFKYLGESGAIEAHYAPADTETPATPANDVVAHIVKASGKAYLLAPNKEVGKEIISAVTLKAITTNSGIDVWGIVSDPLSADLSDASTKLSAATMALEEQRYKRRSPDTAFPATPFHARCSYTGGVASVRAKETSLNGDVFLRSPQVDFLFNYATGARKRLESELLDDSREGESRSGSNPLSRPVVRVRDLSKGISTQSWVGVIHADGNGVGKIFRNLAKVKEGKGFIITQAKLSRGLEEITWDAFRQTVTEVAIDHENSVLPIIVGGDDVVVLVSGAIAPEFAIALTRNFQIIAADETNAHAKVFQEMFDEINESNVAQGLALRDNPQEANMLSMAAGLLMTKQKHPFHHSVEVAEELTSFAKSRSRAESSVAIHVLYEPSLRDLDALRADASVAGKCFLAQPLLTDAAQKGVGTVAELAEMRKVIAGETTPKVSKGILGLFREALTESQSISDATARLKNALKRGEELTKTDSLGLLADIRLDEGESEFLYIADSPSTFITAMELEAIKDVESAGKKGDMGNE